MVLNQTRVHITFKSINPYNNEEIKTYSEQSETEIESILSASDKAFDSCRTVPIPERSRRMLKAAELLRENKETYARTMTLEMGKPITESIY